MNSREKNTIKALTAMLDKSANDTTDREHRWRQYRNIPDTPQSTLEDMMRFEGEDHAEATILKIYIIPLLRALESGNKTELDAIIERINVRFAS